MHILRCLARPLPLMASRPYLVAAVALPIGAALISWRVRRLRSDAQFTARAPPKARLAVLNPRGNHYNDAVLPMLNELFQSIDAALALEEIDISNFRSAADFHLDGSFDGFIVPGSPASVAAGAYTSSADAAPAWITPLEQHLRQLHAKRIPVLGICFGHQVLASAMGGRVETNETHGLHAAACAFEPTALGKHLLGPFGGAQRVEILYHHNDIVSRLPPCAANLGCSTTNPTHAAAYFASATGARLAITRGSLPSGDGERPLAFTVQGHPEFCTPTGRRVLRTILEEDAPKFGSQWLAERLATIGSEATTDTSQQLVAAIVRHLWPGEWLPSAPSR